MSKRIGLSANALLTWATVAITCCLLSLRPENVQAQERPVGSFDPYVEYGRLLSVAEQQFILDDAEGLVRTVGTLSQLHVPETPTYEVNFYRAFLAFKHRRDAEARMLLGAFKDMLRIDSGQARCTERSGYVSLHGRVTASLEAYRVMCGEILYGHYERPTRETLFNVAKYWSFVTLLEEKMSN